MAIKVAGSNTDFETSPWDTNELNIPLNEAINTLVIEYRNDTNPLFGLAPNSLNKNRNKSITSISPRI